MAVAFAVPLLARGVVLVAVAGVLSTLLVSLVEAVLRGRRAVAVATARRVPAVRTVRVLLRISVPAVLAAIVATVAPTVSAVAGVAAVRFAIAAFISPTELVSVRFPIAVAPVIALVGSPIVVVVLESRRPVASRVALAGLDAFAIAIVVGGRSDAAVTAARIVPFDIIEIVARRIFPL